MYQNSDLNHNLSGYKSSEPDFFLQIYDNILFPQRDIHMISSNYKYLFDFY